MKGPRTLASTASALFLAASFVPGLSAQTGTVMGSVSDVQSQAALPGAQLFLEGTGDAVLSGDDGRFMLIAVPAGDHVLRVEFIGYRSLRRSVSVPADGAAMVDFALTPEPVAMDEIVVTSDAGIRRGREVGNTVARLEIDEVRRTARRPCRTFCRARPSALRSQAAAPRRARASRSGCGATAA